MPETKFTPGPWSVFVGNANGTGLIRVETSIDSVASGIHVVSLPRNNESKANAHLIASAPCLYAALEQAIEALETRHACSDACVNADIRECDCRSAYAWRNAHDVLAKSRGES